MSFWVSYGFIIFPVFDASSKIPSGILESNYFDIGNFDECYGYVNTFQNIFYGKYCLGTMKLNVTPKTKELEVVSITKF